MEKTALQKHKKQFWLAGVMASLLLATVITVVLLAFPVQAAICEPKLPGKDTEDSASERAVAQKSMDITSADALRRFGVESAAAVFAQARQNGASANLTYSPVSLSMALSMLAEITSGETQEEVLSAIGVSDSNKLREGTDRLFSSLWQDSKESRLSLSNSIWIREDADYQKDTLQSLAEHCRAESYSMDVSDPATPKAISNWISKHTGGMLDGGEIQITPEELLRLYNAIYFDARWTEPFSENRTKEDVFYLASGETVSVDFMNAQYFGCEFTRDKGYTRVAKNLQGGNRMVFLLPDEGISPADILTDVSFLERALYDEREEITFSGEVTMKIPKFSFESELDLRGPLQTLGIHKAFISGDFSPLLGAEQAFLSEVRQGTAVEVNESGVKAAAFTEMILCKSAPTPEKPQKCELILDRPFVFAIEGTKPADSGNPRSLLFIGAVENPTEK